MKKNKSFKNLNILKIIKQKPKKSTNMNMKSLINSIKEHQQHHNDEERAEVQHYEENQTH